MSSCDRRLLFEAYLGKWHTFYGRVFAQEDCGWNVISSTHRLMKIQQHYQRTPVLPAPLAPSPLSTHHPQVTNSKSFRRSMTLNCFAFNHLKLEHSFVMDEAVWNCIKKWNAAFGFILAQILFILLNWPLWICLLPFTTFCKFSITLPVETCFVLVQCVSSAIQFPLYFMLKGKKFSSSTLHLLSGALWCLQPSVTTLCVSTSGDGAACLPSASQHHQQPSGVIDSHCSGIMGCQCIAASHSLVVVHAGCTAVDI